MKRVFVGIDLSSLSLAKKGKTVSVILQEKGQKLEVAEIFTLQNDEELIALLSMDAFVLCGIDAPLSLPLCVSCQELSCFCEVGRWISLLGGTQDMVFHYRLCDLLVRRTLKNIRPKPPISNGGPVDITPLTMRWLRLSRCLLRSNISLKRVIETYAGGAIQLYARKFGLCGRKPFFYRGHSYRRKELLSALFDAEEIQIRHSHFEYLQQNEDAFDAFFVAITTWCTFHQNYLTPSMLLGLCDAPDFVQPPKDILKRDRQAMAQFFQMKEWSFLPYLV